MLTLRGSLIGAVAFFVCSVLYVIGQIWLAVRDVPAPPPGRAVVAWDLVTVVHSFILPKIHDPFFWVVLIVFMAGASLVLKR
jgi:hypothetical protein